jgi:cell fate (sporulation/competence/biofilm development) regulator YlbF (YheA/YmcA/DUF963 family)
MLEERIIALEAAVRELQATPEVHKHRTKLAADAKAAAKAAADKQGQVDHDFKTRDAADADTGTTTLAHHDWWKDPAVLNSVPTENLNNPPQHT